MTEMIEKKYACGCAKNIGEVVHAVQALVRLPKELPREAVAHDSIGVSLEEIKRFWRAHLFQNLSGAEQECQIKFPKDKLDELYEKGDYEEIFYHLMSTLCDCAGMYGYESYRKEYWESNEGK